MGFVDTLDRAQRRRSFLGVPIGVFFKFVDDQGPYLAAIVSFYATLAVFPILLLATSIFGFVLQGNEELQRQVLDSALTTFPIIGEELGRPDGLQGSTTGVVVGVLAATYGSLGLGQALQNALKHSQAGTITVRLRGSSNGLTLTITDDGIGFDVDASLRKGLGLISIDERVEAIGGTLDIRSRPGAGSTLTIVVPVASDPAAGTAAAESKTPNVSAVPILHSPGQQRTVS